MRAVAGVSVSFLVRLSTVHVHVHTLVCVFYSLTCGRTLGCLHVAAAVNTGARISLGDPAFPSFG